MKRFINHIVIAGVLLLAYSCAEPTEPTPAQQAPGTWVVADFYVNGQDAGDNNIYTRFVLERNETFLLEDQNGILYGGSYTISDTNLTLTADDGSTFDFSVVYLDYQKMQIVQTFTSPTAGDIEIRYLLNKINTGSYLGDGN